MSFGLTLAGRVDATWRHRFGGGAAVQAPLRAPISPCARAVLYRQAPGATLISGSRRDQILDTPLAPTNMPRPPPGAKIFASGLGARIKFLLGVPPMLRPLIWPCAVGFQNGPDRGANLPVGVYNNIPLSARAGPPNWPPELASVPFKILRGERGGGGPHRPGPGRGPAMDSKGTRAGNRF